MATAANTTEAALWCKMARDLVDSRKGKDQDLKTARDQLKTVVDKLESQLNALKVLHLQRSSTFEPTFLKLAGDALAASDKSSKLSQKIRDAALEAAAAGLTRLLGEVSTALAEQKTLAKGFETFDKAYAVLQVSMGQATGWRGARAQGSGVAKALQEATDLMDDSQDLRTQAETLNTQAKLDAANVQLALVKPKLETAKTAANTLEKDAAAYLLAMKQWGTLKPQVQAALQELSGLPCAEKVAGSLQIAFNEACTGITQTPDGVWNGHKEAVEKVRQFAQTLTLGREMSANMLARDLAPTVVDALNRCTAELMRHGEIAPPYAAQAYRDEAMSLAQSGRTDAVGAVAKLNTLRGVVKAEADRIALEKTAALTAQTRYDTAITAMGTLDVPVALFSAFKRVGDGAVMAELADRQWANATSKLSSAADSLTAIQTEFNSLGTSWKAKKAELEAIIQQCIVFIAFPAVGRQALALREAANEALLAFSGVKLQPGIAAYNKAVVDGKPLTTAMRDLATLATQKKVPTGSTDQATFVKALAEATGEVRTLAEKARGEMRSYFDTKELTAPQRRVLQDSWFTKTVAVEDRWQVFRNGAAGDTKAVATALKTARDDLKKLVSDLSKLKTDKLATEAASLTKTAADTRADAAPARIQKAIDELTALGVDASAEKGELDRGGSDYRDLSVRLTAKWDRAMLAQANARKALMAKVRTEIDGPINQAGLVSKVYKKELQQASLDIQLMINTDDPDLLAVAATMQARLKAQIEAITAQPKLYEGNKNRLESLAGEIGKLDKLADTQRTLQTALTEALALAKHTDPVEMAGKVDALYADLDKAKALLVKRGELVKTYTADKTKVRADFDKMKAATSTRVTGKATAFEAFYEARIAEAKGLKGVEGGIPKAIEILAKLQAKLDEINNDDNPLAKLRELDGEEKQNQRLVLDLAAQFEREVSTFLSTTLVEAKAVTKAAEDGDHALAKSLEDVASGATKIVSPYLKNLDLIKRGNQPAPDMARLKADFEQARGMLADARRTAERLIENPDSTNISGPGMGEDSVRDGLAKLSRKWSERTQAFSAALRTVTGAIRTESASDEPDVKANAEKAAKLIEGQLASLFRNEAFASSFSVLMQKPPEDKPGKKTLAAQQLAAREAALRVMRQGLSDVENPLLMRLNDTATNPFEAPTLRVATSGISTVLKEIQLQVLASA